MKHAKIERILSRIKEDFGIDINKYEAIEHIADALRKCNRLSIKKRIQCTDRVENYSIHVPCAHDIILVKTPYIKQDLVKVHVSEFLIPTHTGTFYNQLPIDLEDKNTDTRRHVNTFNENYIRDDIEGRYLEYVMSPPYIELNETDIPAIVVYTAVEVDNEGYPVIPYDAYDACLMYCVYVFMRPRFLSGVLNGNQWQEITQWKERAMAQARGKIPSRNKLNETLDNMTSFNRKIYGRES